MSEASAPKRVTRRTIAKGAAWTVPAVAVATAAPMAAASVPPPAPGDHCYQGGQSVNAFRFYLLQPTIVGDSITLTGTEDTLPETTSVVGVGVGISGPARVDNGDGTVTLTYTVISVSAYSYPYLLISGTNTTGSGSREVTVTQRGSTWTANFESNTQNCSTLDLPPDPA